MDEQKVKEFLRKSGENFIRPILHNADLSEMIAFCSKNKLIRLANFRPKAFRRTAKGATFAASESKEVL